MLIAVLVYNGVVLSATTWLAINTRKTVSAFRESTSIAISVYNTFVISVIAIPIIYLSGSTFDAEAIFLVKSITILVVASFTMFALFVPKLYVLFVAKDKNVLKESTSSSIPGKSEMTILDEKKQEVDIPVS